MHVASLSAFCTASSSVNKRCKGLCKIVSMEGVTAIATGLRDKTHPPVRNSAWLPRLKSTTSPGL